MNRFVSGHRKPWAHSSVSISGPSRIVGISEMVAQIELFQKELRQGARKRTQSPFSTWASTIGSVKFSASLFKSSKVSWPSEPGAATQ